MQFSLDVRVYIEDTDAGGIVYYVNYLKFMERARTEFMRALGYGKTAIFSDDKMFVVHTANVKYLGAAKLDDELIVTARPVKIAHSNIVFEQHVVRRNTIRGDVLLSGETTSTEQPGVEQELLCSGEIRIACVDKASGKPCAMPDAMYQQVKQSAQES